MFEGMDSVLNIYSVPSNISYKSLKIDAKFLDCDHRLNFDSLIVHVNQTSQSRLHQHCIISLSYTVFIFLSIFAVGISKSLISLSREDLPHRLCRRDYNEITSIALSVFAIIYIVDLSALFTSLDIDDRTRVYLDKHQNVLHE